jgi:hypothetical protein
MCLLAPHKEIATCYAHNPPKFCTVHTRARCTIGLTRTQAHGNISTRLAVPLCIRWVGATHACILPAQGGQHDHPHQSLGKLVALGTDCAIGAKHVKQAAEQDTQASSGHEPVILIHV